MCMMRTKVPNKARKWTSQRIYSNKVLPNLFKIFVAKIWQTWKRKCIGMGVDFGGVCLYTYCEVCGYCRWLLLMTRKIYNKWLGNTRGVQKMGCTYWSRCVVNVSLDNEEIQAYGQYVHLREFCNRTDNIHWEIIRSILVVKKTGGRFNGI